MKFINSDLACKIFFTGDIRKNHLSTTDIVSNLVSSTVYQNGIQTFASLNWQICKTTTYSKNVQSLVHKVENITCPWQQEMINLSAIFLRINSCHSFSWHILWTPSLTNLPLWVIHINILFTHVHGLNSFLSIMVSVIKHRVKISWQFKIAYMLWALNVYISAKFHWRWCRCWQNCWLKIFFMDEKLWCTMGLLWLHVNKGPMSQTPRYHWWKFAH